MILTDKIIFKQNPVQWPISFPPNKIILFGNTKAGKIIIDNLKKSKNIALSKFEEKGKELKELEDSLNKQKNILSKEDFIKRAT